MKLLLAEDEVDMSEALVDILTYRCPSHRTKSQRKNYC